MYRTSRSGTLHSCLGILSKEPACLDKIISTPRDTAKDHAGGQRTFGLACDVLPVPCPQSMPIHMDKLIASLLPLRLEKPVVDENNIHLATEVDE